MLSNLSSGEGGAGNSAMENNVNISDNHVKDRDGAVSGAIVRENIRRFWPIGLVSLLIYVAMGPVTWIISPPLQQETIISGEESTTIIHASPINYSAFAFIGMIFAAVVAIAVFRYMHSPAALSALHAFPVRKRALFFSNFVSGLLLIFVPFIAAVLSLLPLIAARSDAPSLMASWLTWLVAVCITVFFTYAVSVLAGMVSGTTPAHMLTAGVFNFAWIAIYGSAAAIVTESMFGMSGESDFMSAGLYLHPLTYFLSGIDVNTIVVGAGEVVPLYVGMPVYLAVSVLVLAASYFVFMRFKAERAGMPITARPVEHIFAFAVSAIGMFLFAVIFASQDPVRLSPDGQQPADPMTYVNTYAVLGAVIGAVVSFLIATMIIRKSARVFDLAALRRFGIFAAAAAVFFVCAMTNITGFETRVPDAGDVKAATFYVGNYLEPPYRYGVLSIDSGYYIGGVYVPVQGEDDVETLIAFQRKALEDRAYIRDPGVEEDGVAYPVGGSNQPFSIGYGLKGGGEVLRSYVFSGKYLLGSGEYARLLSSDSVKDYLSIENLLGYDALNVPKLHYGSTYNIMDVDPDTEIRSKLSGGAMKELAACLDEDYRAMGANDMMNPGKEIFTLWLSSSKPGGTMYESIRAALSGKGMSLYSWTKKEELGDSGLSYTVTEKSSRTIAWLKEKGVYDSLVKSAEELKRGYEAEFSEEKAFYDKKG